MGSRTCHQCRAEIPDGHTGACPACGAALPADPAGKKPFLAALLSLAVPGLGQSYNGNALKGIGLFLAIGIIIALMLSTFRYFDVFLLAIALIWGFGIYDACRDAGLMNEGKIPAKPHQILLFCGMAVVAGVIFAIVYGTILFFFILSGVSQMNYPVVCLSSGEGCITPLKGAAVCNTTAQCMDNARTRMKARYFSDAEKYLDNALALSPGNAEVLVLKGVAQAERKNNTAALVSLDQAVALDPAMAAAWENRGIVKARSGNTSGSLTDLETAVMLPGNASLAWYNLGVAHARSGDASDAIAAYDTALMREQNCMQCLMMKGKSLNTLGKYDDARKVFAGLVASGQDRIVSNQGLGTALAGLGRESEACDAFGTAIEANPFDKADIWGGLCNTTTAICAPEAENIPGLSEQALAAYDEQLKTRQNDPDLWLRKGETLVKLNRYDEAVASFEKAAGLKTGNAEALNGKGVALFYKGDYPAALVELDLAVKADRALTKAWNNGAFVFVKQKDYKRAVKAYTNAIRNSDGQTDPDNTAAFRFDTSW